MRLALALACLLLAGCAGPHSTGALWAQENLELELATGRLTDAERADRAHAYELVLADESLAAERARIDVGLQDCPGPARQPLELSVGDRIRDSIRLRVGDDPPRQAAVAQLALADWRLRRGRATADTRFCTEAGRALSGTSSGDPSVGDLLAAPGAATVTRDARQTGAMVDAAPVMLTLSNYALGYADAVRAPTPLAQYLAAVYGGSVVDRSRPPALDGQTPEALVDRLAPTHPEWEPDAIYEALRAA